MNMSLSVAVVPCPDIFTQTVAANVELCQPAGWRSPLDNLKAVIGERTPHATQSFLVMTGGISSGCVSCPAGEKRRNAV